jgi:tetratricopeptide (TPR) repeat protein
MKRSVYLSLLILISLSLSAQDYAQNSAPDSVYIEKMKETIIMMDSLNSVEYLHRAANQFERIGNARPDQWLPYYYSAYCYVQISHLVQSDEQKDGFVDKAEELNELAERISPDNSEIYVMKGFILQARMSIDPMIRGLKLNKECLAMFEKAKHLDPENPRSYLWYGVNLYNTPTVMGGGKAKALPLIEMALEKFEIYHLQSELHPSWGKKYAEQILTECKEQKIKE